MVDLHPTKCNICGGKVIYGSNAEIYGREYGSGKCYRCLTCGAYVGTHKPRPREALGLLADERMRAGKKACHSVFDSKWDGMPKARKKRKDMYLWLSRMMDIPVGECHFGYFNLEQLRKAYRILMSIKDEPLVYDASGKIVNHIGSDSRGSLEERRVK